MKELPEDIQAKITAYIEGQLRPDEAAALEVYLANTDPAISEMVIGMLADRHSVQNLPRLAAPHDFSARVMEQIERSSLLAGVEHELIPHRPWWQTRAAIAAGLALVLGGFTYFVVDAISRPAQPWHNGTAVVPPAGNVGAVALARGDRKLDEATESESVRDNKKSAPMPTEGVKVAFKDASDDGANQALLSEAANDVSRRSQAGEKGITARNGAPAALTMNLERSSDEQMRVSGQVAVARDRMTAAKDNGFLVEESPQKALSTVYARDNRSLEGPPVLVTLVSRRADDPERLRVMLESFASEDARLRGNTAADAKQAAEPAYFGTGNLAVNNTGGNALALNGSNVSGPSATTLNNITATGNTTTNAGNVTSNAAPGLNGGGTGGTVTITAKGANTFDGNRNGNSNQYGGDGTLNNGGRNQFNGNYDNYAVQGKLSQQQAGMNSQLANGATQDLVSPVAQFARSASPYRRVYLRPRQLERITAEFQVASISRGQLAYVIAPHEEAELRKEKSEYAVPREGLEKTLAPNGPVAAPGGYPARAVTRAPARTLPRAASEVPAPATRFQPAMAAATQPAGGGSGGSARGGFEGKSGAGARDSKLVDKDDKDRVGSSPINDREAKAKGDRQDQPESGAAEQQKAEAGPWLEVIIAMEPGAVASPAGSAPASMQSEGQFNSKGAGKPASK